MNSLTLDTDNFQRNFWLDGGYYTIGAGGVTFNKRANISVGRSSATDSRVILNASQEWRGTQTGAERSNFSIGHMNWSSYYKMTLKVTDDVEWWKISGLLNVWIGGQNTLLGNVAVTVEAPARLLLAAKHTISSTTSSTTYYPDARLGAKKLVMKGDGFRLVTSQENNFIQYAPIVYCVNTLDAVHVAPAIELVDGADLSLTNGLFAIPSVSVSGSGTSEVIGSFSNNLASTSIAFSDGATLCLDAQISDGAAGPSAISATGNGTLKINLSKYTATGALSLGEDISLCLTGTGWPTFQFTGAKELILDIGDGGTNYLSDAALSGFSGNTVTVKSGTLILQSRSSLSGKTLVEDGGAVLYSTDVPMIVTDEAKSDAEITVGDGDEIQIYGNGLTAATQLKLTGGTVMFVRPATISSPIAVSDAVATLDKISDRIYAQIGGAVSASSHVHINGPGWLEFSGGATFSGNAWLYAYDGQVKLTGGTYHFEDGGLKIGTAVTAPTGNSWLGPWCRRFVVGNGANVTFTGHTTGDNKVRIQVYPLPDGAAYNRESVLEIASGGTVTLPKKSDIHLGNNQNIGTLHINGGTFSTGAYGHIYLGHGGYATGQLTIDSGLLELGGSIARAELYGQGYVTWNGGTIRLGNWDESGRNIITSLGNYIPGKDTMRCSVNVAGDDCVLDLTQCRHASITNMPSVHNGMFNEWWGHGRLTVKGGKDLVMTSFPDGLRLRLEGDGTTVTFPSDGKVYDYDTCLTNCQWRKPYGALSRYNVTNSWLAAMSFSEVTFAGTNCAFVCNRESTPVSATNVTVSATGASGVAESLPEGTVLKDVTFADGATWLLGATSLDVPGRLAFGGSLRFSAANLPHMAGRVKVASAAEGIVGVPETTAVGSRRSCRLSFDVADEVYAYPIGTMMIFR